MALPQNVALVDNVIGLTAAVNLTVGWFAAAPIVPGRVAPNWSGGGTVTVNDLWQIRFPKSFPVKTLSGAGTMTWDFRVIWPGMPDGVYYLELVALRPYVSNRYPGYFAVQFLIRIVSGAADPTFGASGIRFYSYVAGFPTYDQTAGYMPAPIDGTGSTPLNYLVDRLEGGEIAVSSGNL